MSFREKMLITTLCLLITLSLFLLSSCTNKQSLTSEKSIDFPLDSNGYPKNDVVIVNGKPYPINLKDYPHEASEFDAKIKIKMQEDTDNVEIILPQYLPINYWSIDESNFLNLNSYVKTICPIKEKHLLEGVSPAVQQFNIQVPEKEISEIYLKWTNINEADKSFTDKDEDYLLKIVISC